MGILLGLLTALTWGSADFIARFATHRIGTLRTMLYMQFIGFLLLTICLPWLGGWGHLADGSGWQPWAWGFLAGFFNACSTLALYRAFEIGKMAVVAPLSASYPALTLSLSWIGGDRLRACAGREQCTRGSNGRPGDWLGDRGRSWIRRALLAAGRSSDSACRRHTNSVDDSDDEHRADRHGDPSCQSADASAPGRSALDGPRHGRV